MTHYDVLGIDRTAKEAEIKKAYHQMLIAFHPDKYQGDKQFAAKKTRELVEAYRVLGQPVSRKSYDELLNSQKPPAAGSGIKNGSPYSHVRYAASGGLRRYKTALIVAGLIFAFAAVTFFLSILLSLYA